MRSIAKRSSKTALRSGNGRQPILPHNRGLIHAGHTYKYDPAKAKQLLKEAGYNSEPINFKYGAGNATTNQYAQVIQSSLNDIGLNVQIETLEVKRHRQQLAQGQFQMYTGVWIGGNRIRSLCDDLFARHKIPGDKRAVLQSRPVFKSRRRQDCRRRDQRELTRLRQKQLYVKAWDIVSNDLPLLPLWYPANIVVSNKRIGNIKMSGSGDWGFLKEYGSQ